MSMVMDSKETKAKVLVDGFGGMAVVDISELDKDIIQNLNDESVWEVFDGVERLDKGIYLVTLRFWWESNFPEGGDELVIETASHEIVAANP